MEASDSELCSDRSIKSMKKLGQRTTHSKMQRVVMENDKAWSEIQRQRIECLLRTSNEPGLCGACDLIDGSANFSHHDSTALRESAQMCRICQLFLDLAKKGVRGNPSSEVSSANGRLFHKFYNYPVATFDIITINGNNPSIGKSVTSIASDAPFRDIQQDPLSEECIELVSGWIQNCLSTHKQCVIQSPTFKPSRLIEINGKDVALRELRDLPGDDIRYCALSYCWGQSNPLKTTLKNLSHHRIVIPTHSLPKTVRDAIIVTQRLGIKYLWVDSLCIVQDSASDWEKECSKMGEYYKLAYLVLSALDSADARDGFLYSRPNINLTTSSANGELRIRAQLPTRKLVFKNAALNQRGWALQERMLSTRILHFSNTELFWECLTCTAREGSLITHGYEVNSDLVVDSDGDDLKASFYNTGQDPFAIEDGAFSLWYRIVKLYTRKTLSHSSDKLAAVTGLAAMIADKENAHYQFGLWEQDIHGLTWTRATKTFQRLDAFPSWSWLSWDGPVNYQMYAEPRMNSINDAKVIGVGLDLGPGPQDNHFVLSAFFKEVRCLAMHQIGNLNAKSRAEQMGFPRQSKLFRSELHHWVEFYDSNFSIGVYDDQRNIMGIASMDYYTDGDPTGYLCLAICIGERYRHSIYAADNQVVEVATYFLLIDRDNEAKDHWRRFGLGVTREIREVSQKQSSKMFRGCHRKQFCLI